MTEPDVTLTDYFITLISISFMWGIYRHHLTENLTYRIWLLFFFSIALSSLLGGTVHGFCSNETTNCYAILWTSTLITIGLTAALCWILGGYLLFTKHVMWKWMLFVIALYLLYIFIIIFYQQLFYIAILNYLPAITFLFIANLIFYLKTKMPACLWIMSGILISFLAAYVQQAHIAFHPVYFNHNASYHLIQIAGLFLVFKGAKLQSNNKGQTGDLI